MLSATTLGWLVRNPKSNLVEFCDDRNLSDALRQAFLTYCKSMFSSRYLMSPNGDTINKFVAEMSYEQVLDAWNQFLNDMRAVMPEVLTS